MLWFHVINEPQFEYNFFISHNLWFYATVFLPFFIIPTFQGSLFILVLLFQCTPFLFYKAPHSILDILLVFSSNPNSTYYLTTHLFFVFFVFIFIPIFSQDLWNPKGLISFFLLPSSSIKRITLNKKVFFSYYLYTVKKNENILLLRNFKCTVIKQKPMFFFRNMYWKLQIKSYLCDSSKKGVCFPCD